MRPPEPGARRWVAHGVHATVGALVALATLTALAAPPTGRPASLDDLSLRVVPATGSREGDELRAWLIAGAPANVVRGAETYDWHCAVCHGDTGLGYAEARLSFPEDHRTCTGCHRKGNQREMSFEEMNARHNDVFDIGDPPALRGDGALAAFGSVEALLFAYTRSSMPRYQPGRLSDDDYADLVAFMLWLREAR
jgi:hypothetical protein